MGNTPDYISQKTGRKLAGVCGTFKKEVEIANHRGKCIRKSLDHSTPVWTIGHDHRYSFPAQIQNQRKRVLGIL